MELVNNILSFAALLSTIFFIVQNVLGLRNNKSRKYFALFLASIGYVILFFLLLDLGYQAILLPTIPIFLGAILSITPLLWTYANDVIGQKKIEIKSHFVLPIFTAVTCLVLMVTNYGTKGMGSMSWMQDVLLYFVMGSMSILFIGQSVFYIYKLFTLYNEHNRNIMDVFSYSERIDLTWLLYLILGYLLFIGGLVIVHLVEDEYSGLLFNFILLCYILYSGVQGYRQFQIFTAEEPAIETQEELEVKLEEPTDESPKISATQLVFEEIEKSIISLMNEERIYLNDNLTVHDVAKRLNTNGKYVSQVVNSKFEKTFVTFINEYRIAEAKFIFEEGGLRNYTIETIGYQSGFKSKSAFNNAFKKFTGMTPTQYIKSNNLSHK